MTDLDCPAQILTGRRWRGWEACARGDGGGLGGGVGGARRGRDASSQHCHHHLRRHDLVSIVVLTDSVIVLTNSIIILTNSVLVLTNSVIVPTNSVRVLNYSVIEMLTRRTTTLRGAAAMRLRSTVTTTFGPHFIRRPISMRQ